MKTLRKISFGVFAFIIGLGLVLTQSAFTGSSTLSGRAVKTLYYHGPDFSLANVTDESNWNGNPVEETCQNVNIAACSITIDDSYVDASGPVDQLQNSANLTATLASGKAFITGSADPTMTRVNSDRD